jgi:hypothetical protein
MLEVPQAMLDERQRLGLDGRDEMWDGELHMVPPPRTHIRASRPRCSRCLRRWAGPAAC